MIEEEYHRTVEAVLRVSGDGDSGGRFPRFRRRLARRLPALNQVSRQQVELLRRFRGPERGGAEGRAVGAAAVDQLHCGGVRGDRLAAAPAHGVRRQCRAAPTYARPGGSSILRHA